MKNIKTKIIAAILSLTLIFQAGYVEIGAKAETAKNDATPNITKQNADKTISENIDDLKIVSEVTDKREENVKHFMLNNGTFMAVTYNEPVHIKNNNGFYEDIDNSLTEDENSGEFKQKHSLNKIKLAKNTDSAKLVKMQMNGYNLSWNFEGINKSKVIKTDLKEKGENLNGNEKFTSLQNLTGKAKYENIFNDTDLEYYVGTENVKENIILKSKNAPDSFIINYNIDKLTAKQEDSKTINLLNGNEVVFTLSAPEMTDALGEMSTDITLEILSVKNKKLTVKCTADKDWINNKNRVFPITVDPSAVFMLGSNNITYKYSYTNTSVTENAPGTLYVGYDTTLGTACSTIKLNSLPSLSKGDMVYNAQLALYLNHFRLDTKTKEINIDAYEVNGNWGGYAYSTVYVKGNGPAFFSNVLDYQKASAALMHNYKYWDITKLVKKWYNGAANNGIVLKASNTYTTDDNLALFSTPENAPVGTDYKKPAFIIYYLNAKGLEDYWSYSESSAGSAAASVNNYTGNLVASVPLSSTISNNMPAELSLYYNNCQSGNHFSNSICGGNFKTNYDIVINAISAGTALNNALRAEGYYYTYTDSDGTVHYMKTTATDKSDKGTYKDESGLGLTLTKSNGFVLEDKDHNKMKFDAQGKITQIFNKYSASTTEDTIRFSYTGNFLSSITDGSGKKLTLARNQNNALISVTDEFGRKTALNYSGSKMVKVDYPNGNSVKFSYTSDYLLEKLTAEDGTYLLFNYPSSGTAVDKSRVSKVTEYSNNAEQRNYVTFTYNIDNTTTIKDENNNSETYVFDNIGRAFSVYSDDGAASSEWQTVTGANATFTNNKVKTSYAAEKPIINRLNNPGFEGSDGLTGWSKTGGNVTSANNIKYIGQKAVKINHTSQSTDSVYQNITDSTGLYTLSAYVKTENITAAGNTFGGCLYISYKNNGTEYTKRSKYLTGTNDWDRIYFSEDIPGSATDVKAGFRLENASGTAYIDNMQFESGYISDYNMAQNTCFEKGNTGYMGTVNAGNISSGAPSYLKKSTKINGAAGNAYYIGQTVFIGKPAKNLAINVAAYAKANSVAIKDNRSFGVKVFFYYTDGTQELCPVKSFNPYTTAWQYMSYVAMTGSAHQNKTVNYINVYFIYDYNRNSAEFTGLTVKIDPTAQSFSYDSKGNVQSAKTAGGKEGYNNFDSTTNNLLSNSDSKNGHFTYTYNTGDYKYQLKKANHSGYTQQFDFEYNSHGQVTKQTQHHTNATTYPVYQSTNEYSQNGSKLLSQTNTTDIKTSYNYDSYDRVASVTSGGISTNYTYDSSNRVTSVSAKRDKNNNETTVTNNYTYDSFGKLLNIQHGNTNYAFTYNNFGEKTSTKVGNRVLAQYSYDSRGNIKSTSYGNGNVTQNTYDNKNRLTNITKTGGCSNSYFYNSAGQLAKESYTSPQYSVTQNYLYDLLGRVVNVNFENKNLTVNYGYNNIDQLTKVRYNLNGSNHGVDYTYYNWNINLTSTLTNGTVVKKDLGHLAQLHHLTHYNTSGKAVRRTVTNTVRNNKDIGLPATITYKNGTFASNNFTPDEQSTVSYNYTYDYFGNLTEVFKNGEKQEQYAYDDLSQLVRADNKQNNTTTEYTYDNHGNLLSTRTTAFTFGEIDRSAPYTLTDYSYNDSSWGDLLTAYNGAVITYDEIGNPINYYNGAVMQWTGGRNLSQYQKGSNTYSYAYNANNLRTLKTVNGVTTEYYLDGSKIIAMQTGEGAEGLLKYYYDADGTRLAVESNGKVYYYKYNTTGDVISLMDEDFNDIAYYSYNAYGKPESVTDASGNDISQNSEYIANKNPFRYRGYYYDSETGLYYLQSRYYDPEIGRFINADNTIAGVGGDVRGYNLFSYCMNNPVNMSDHTGNWPQWIKKAVRAVVKAVKKAVAVVINAFKPARSSVKNIVKTSSNSLSPKGKPGSSQTLPNSDGTPKQKRWYGPDGTPERDRDYNHPGNMPFPHDHKWENGERGTDHLPPDPSYKMNWEPVIGVGLVVICVAGIIVVAADDATGIGVADDVLFGPLGAGVSKGLIKIFG